jgi:hypothetical protein
MNLPSIKTLDLAFPGKGKILRRLLESAAAVREHPAAVELARQCYNPPGLAYMRLTALNVEAGTYGAEAVWRVGEEPGDCTSSPAFEYLNTGDTYALTLIRWAGGRYQVASWGDIVERGNYA